MAEERLVTPNQQPSAWSEHHKVPIVESPDGNVLGDDGFMPLGVIAQKAGENAPAGPKGDPGSDGADGQSAWELYAEAETAAGRTPLPLNEWLLSLEGSDGQDGAPGADGLDAYGLYVQQEQAAGRTPLSLADWLASLQGADGQDGAPGADGADGRSAYQSYVDVETAAGRTPLSEAEWSAARTVDQTARDSIATLQGQRIDPARTVGIVEKDQSGNVTARKVRRFIESDPNGENPQDEDLTGAFPDLPTGGTGSSADPFVDISIDDTQDPPVVTWTRESGSNSVSIGIPGAVLVTGGGGGGAQNFTHTFSDDNAGSLASPNERLVSTGMITLPFDFFDDAGNQVATVAIDQASLQSGLSGNLSYGGQQVRDGAESAVVATAVQGGAKNEVELQLKASGGALIFGVETVADTADAFASDISVTISAA